MAAREDPRPVDGSTLPTESMQINDRLSEKRAVVICFPGSGSDPLPGWDEFVRMARDEYTVVLLDRGTTKIAVNDANSALLKHLKLHRLKPPYVLIAHSYGGAFAKMFLHQKPEMVAGMLLVETGQEGGLPEQVEQSLLSRSPLGNKPLSVIRGNSLIAMWKALETAEPAADTISAKTELGERRKLLEACDLEDERLKKSQLQMSTNTRYIHLPDCGHGVIRDRPDIVLEELHWVTANLQAIVVPHSLWTRLQAWWQATRSH